MATAFEHTPVLLEKVLELLDPIPAGTFVDATLGGGGHSAALLRRRPDLNIIGIDRDEDALDAGRERLAEFGDRVRIVKARFDDLGEVLESEGISQVSGVLFDLGVSSPQFDRPERGFSYRTPGPIDMRQDRGQAKSAADLVNRADQAELERVLRDFGDERYATRIARAIVAARPLSETLELAEVVTSAIPARSRRSGGHPAKRSFQAFRIWTNDELDVLVRGLDSALSVTAPGGRVLVISFHSGEDRIVKARFREAETGGCACPPALPCACGAVPVARLLKRGGWTATDSELQSNPRASSARLRAVEILPFRSSEDLS